MKFASSHESRGPSDEGFALSSGLLTLDPHERLTAQVHKVPFTLTAARASCQLKRFYLAACVSNFMNDAVLPL